MFGHLIIHIDFSVIKNQNRFLYFVNYFKLIILSYMFCLIIHWMYDTRIKDILG